MPWWIHLPVLHSVLFNERLVPSLFSHCSFLVPMIFLSNLWSVRFFRLKNFFRTRYLEFILERFGGTVRDGWFEYLQGFLDFSVSTIVRFLFEIFGFWRAKNSFGTSYSDSILKNLYEIILGFYLKYSWELLDFSISGILSLLFDIFDLEGSLIRKVSFDRDILILSRIFLIPEQFLKIHIKRNFDKIILITHV